MRLTQNALKEMFDYIDGVLYWKIKCKGISIGQPAGCLNQAGYLRTGIKGKSYRNHRLIFLMHHGYLPKTVDHIDLNKLNNRIENLREATDSQNKWNSKKSVNNTSGHKGIKWCKKSKKWIVQVRKSYKLYYFGSFDNIGDALVASFKARQQLHGEFARWH